MARGFEGIDQLISDLGELGRRALPEAAVRGLMQGAREIVPLAKSYTPYLSGRSRASIGILEAPTATADSARVEIGSALFYFPYVEYGGRRSPARRPIGRAVDEVEPRIEVYVMAELERLARGLNL